MRSSSAAVLLAAMLAVGGCAATVRRGDAPAPAPGPSPAAGSAAPAAAPAERGTHDGSAPGPARVAGGGDPSEEITARELATIPDPVPETTPRPGAASRPSSEAGVGPEGSSPISPDSVAPGGREAPSVAGGAASADGETGWTWQVQIYATERAEEADRVAREAEARLGARAVVVREGSLHKVRLGRFATEGEARSLRERAVLAGYHGAFRIQVR